MMKMSRPATAAMRRFSPRHVAVCLALACVALLLAPRGRSAASDGSAAPPPTPAGACPMGAAWHNALHSAELPANISASSDGDHPGGEAPARPRALQPTTASTPLSGDEQRAELAELGRAAWRVIHATAKKVEDARDLDLYLQFMHSFVAVYPCRLCRTHAWAKCGELMSAPTLVGLHAAARRCSPREAAQAYAARLHACVTRNNVADQQAIVSAESRHIADAVAAADVHGDAAVVRAVADAKSAAGPDAQ